MTTIPAFGKPALGPALGIALTFALSACASAPDGYPSLAIRDIERVYGSAEPVAPPPPPPVIEPSTELAERLVQLQDQASQAHQAFLSAMPRASQLVAAARQSEIADDPWVAAQSGLSHLEASRNRAMLVMADLDRMLVAVEMDGGAREAIAQAQANVDALVNEENTLLEGLIAQLPG
ncbi:hypothetical protein MB02_05875 [Croceicoccus estronivorus]|uniref:hypothetical protein n=1 Tax=Croceicoccus estronivorus TaxID=1172626 RepID=UPI000837A252|nr:hypothetical protein [Croceicoccus estronivorus]OCC24968.1 hypothetical protein MB02_05875 [Croceicoccus estronivorus]